MPGQEDRSPSVTHEEEEEEAEATEGEEEEVGRHDRASCVLRLVRWLFVLLCTKYSVTSEERTGS